MLKLTNSLASRVDIELRIIIEVRKHITWLFKVQEGQSKTFVEASRTSKRSTLISRKGLIGLREGRVRV